MGFEVGDQRFTVLLTLFLSAQRIHFELHRTNAKRLPHAREHHNDFGINVRARHAERFSAELMELTVAGVHDGTSGRSTKGAVWFRKGDCVH